METVNNISVRPTGGFVGESHQKANVTIENSMFCGIDNSLNNWNGGFIEYVPQGGMLERVGIRSHAGGVVQLSRPPQYLAAGMAVSIFPGCDRTTGANGCAKFGNLPNYGGFPHFPTKNPFGNDPVY